MSSLPAQLALQLILILINGFFAATELAIISLSPVKLRKLQEQGDKTAPRLIKLVEEPSGFLSTIQVGITLAGYLGSAFAAENFSGYLVKWITDGLGFKAIPLEVLNILAIVLITIILAYFTLVLGELVPKRIAMQKSYAVAKFSCGVVSGISVVMRPIIWFLSKSTNGVLRLLRMKTEAEEETVTEDEIRMLVELGGEKGAIEQAEEKWIQNLFEFGDTAVRQAMTPRGKVRALPSGASDLEILSAIKESGHSRYPVYQGTIDSVVGILNARDFLMDRNEGGSKPMDQLLRPAYFAPETIPAAHLFQQLQKEKAHLAIVVDEYGGTQGVITLEDLIEEIFGNIYDEFDAAEPPIIENVGPGEWRVSGRALIDELNDALKLSLPEGDDYDTLGGLIVTRLNVIPKDGEHPSLQLPDLELTVESTQKHHIKTVLIKKQEENR